MSLPALSRPPAAESRGRATRAFDAGALARAMEQAVDAAVLAPSVHNTQPWRFEVREDRLLVRADRRRRLAVLDPHGRELVISVGAALFNARVALADTGWRTRVQRCPETNDPDLLAVVRAIPGTPHAALAALAPAIPRRRTNRRPFAGGELPEGLFRRLTALASAEATLLVPVLSKPQRNLVARLTQQADRLQNAEPAYRAEVRRWTTRRPGGGDGVPPAVVAHVDGLQHDDLPLRDLDTTGAGALPARTRSGTDQTLLLLATRGDDPLAWLHAGEALQRILLELTNLGWVASPLTQPIEVPLTRMQLRSSVTWHAYPQLLLRVGRAAPTLPTPRRRRDDVIIGAERPPAPAPAAAQRLPAAPPPAPCRPVSDGRGGTTWI